MFVGRVAQVVQRPRSGGFTSASADPDQHPVEQGMYLCMYVRICVCMYLCTYVRMYEPMYVRMS